MAKDALPMINMQVVCKVIALNSVQTVRNMYTTEDTICRAPWIVNAVATCYKNILVL